MISRYLHTLSSVSTGCNYVPRRNLISIKFSGFELSTVKDFIDSSPPFKPLRAGSVYLIIMSEARSARKHADIMVITGTED